MANTWYAKGIKKFGRGEIVWLAAGGSTIKAVLVDLADYALDAPNHEFLSDIPAAARVATGTLTLIDIADGGILDANDLTFASVSGDQSEAIVIYKETGAEGTAPLLIYVDNATGLPVTPNGGNINIQWDNGANKIAKL